LVDTARVQGRPLRFDFGPLSTHGRCPNIMFGCVASSTEVFEPGYPISKTDRFTTMVDFVIVRGGGTHYGRGARLYFGGRTDVQQGEVVARQPRVQELCDRRLRYLFQWGPI